MSQELIDQCAKGDFSAVKASVAGGADVNYRGKFGNTPLGYSWADVEIMDFLLANGADPNGLSYEDGSPLALAAYETRSEAVDRLLRHGADPHFRDPAGVTPLHFAVAKKERATASKCVLLLLNSGADPNVQTKEDVETNAFYGSVRVHSESPLHWAAANADKDTVQHLLDHGANKSAKDGRGETPMQWAGRHQRPHEIRKLLTID
jgi:cytohesin